MKKIERILLLITVLIGLIRSESDYQFALVLSGGGARGLAQIGVLKALEEHGLKPDLIVATSMGSIIGSLYASGLSPEMIHRFTSDVDWNRVVSNEAQRDRLFVNQKTSKVNYLFELRFDERLRPVLPSALSSGQAFYDLLSPTLLPAQFSASNDFTRLSVSLRIVATDILTGDRVVFSEGNLSLAVRASCTVPLAFSPIEHDGKLLMDGGLTSNIPVSTAVRENAAFILAIDVTSPLWEKDDLENPVRLADQLVAIGIEKNKNEERVLADLIITPDLQGFQNTNFRNIDTLITIGYEATVNRMDEIRSSLSYKGYKPKNPSGKTVPLRVTDRTTTVLFDSDSLTFTADCDKKTIASKIKFYLNDKGIEFAELLSVQITDSLISVKAIPATAEHFTFTGHKRTSDRTLRTAGGFRANTMLSSELLGNYISNLYSTELFETVNIDVDTINNVTAIIDEKKMLRLRGGLRFDEYHLLEGYIQPASQNFFGTGITTSLHIQYGSRREKYALDFLGNHLFTSNLANSLHLQAYISKERIFEREKIEIEGQTDLLSIREMILRKSGLQVMAGTQLWRFASLDAGMRYELYSLQQSDKSIFDDALGLRFRSGMPYFMLRFIIDTIDRTPFPTGGIRHTVNLGMASDELAGTENFFKLDGSSEFFLTLGKKNIIHPQFIWSWANASLPEAEKVYLGGAFPEQAYRDLGIYNYIPFRGLKPRAFSGDMLALFHIDYSFMFLDNLFFTFDVDYGRAWEQLDFASRNLTKDFFSEGLLGVGAGMAYNSVIGALRFTYGLMLTNLKEEGIDKGYQFYISLGQDF